MGAVSIEIRRMRDEEAARVSEILHACFRWLAEREGFTPRQLDFLLNARSSEETVLEESRTRPHLVALSGGRVIGMVVVNGNEIARLYVDPASHRQGIGQVLFETAEDMIRRAGFDEMRVGALVGGAAAFYKSMGMAVAGHVAWEPDIFGEREVTIMTKKV